MYAIAPREGNVGGLKIAHGTHLAILLEILIWNQLPGTDRDEVRRAGRLRTLKSRVSSYCQKVEAVSREFDLIPASSPSIKW